MQQKSHLVLVKYASFVDFSVGIAWGLVNNPFRISELPVSYVSERVLVHSLLYGNVQDKKRFTRQATSNHNSLAHYKLCFRTRFETEGKGNSEIAYLGIVYITCVFRSYKYCRSGLHNR